MSAFISNSYYKKDTKDLGSFVKTFRVRDKKNVKHITKKTRDWKRVAIDRIKMAQFYEAKERLQDSHFIIDIVISKLEDKSLENPIVYTAQDKEKCIQGIALARMYKGYNCLEYLITNPNNIPVSPVGATLRGVGTKLVAHFAKDVLTQKKKESEKLYLLSRPSAVDFYKKLGFKMYPEENHRDLVYMELDRAGMKELVKKSAISKEEMLLYTQTR